MCNNYSSSAMNIFWFRMTNGPNISSISSMFNSDSKASLWNGFQNGNFIMTSNITNLFLKIKSVDVSDSGLYFCGCCPYGVSALVSPTYLKVQGDSESDDDIDCTSQNKSDENTNLMGVILGGLTVFFVMVIIGQVVKIKKLRKAQDQEPNAQHRENFGPETRNYAPLSFHPKTKGSGRPERALESHAVYFATR
uniref:Ig-like domain-containing protein n=1 Tax=Stegastes partitus TaxID=144197 RepID=A0A3B4ZSI3_9TELE